jgi:hypothetical protein
MTPRLGLWLGLGVASGCAPTDHPCGAEYGGGGTATLGITPLDDAPLVPWSGTVAGLSGAALGREAFDEVASTPGAALRHFADGQHELVVRLPAEPAVVIEGQADLTWVDARLEWSPPHDATNDLMLRIELFDVQPLDAHGAVCTIGHLTGGIRGATNVDDQGWSGTISTVGSTSCADSSVGGESIAVTIDVAYDFDAATYVDDVRICD